MSSRKSPAVRRNASLESTPLSFMHLGPPKAATKQASRQYPPCRKHPEGRSAVSKLLLGPAGKGFRICLPLPGVPFPSLPRLFRPARPARLDWLQYPRRMYLQRTLSCCRRTVSQSIIVVLMARFMAISSEAFDSRRYPRHVVLRMYESTLALQMQSACQKH